MAAQIVQGSLTRRLEACVRFNILSWVFAGNARVNSFGDDYSIVRDNTKIIKKCILIRCSRRVSYDYHTSRFVPASTLTFWSLVLTSFSWLFLSGRFSLQIVPQRSQLVPAGGSTSFTCKGTFGQLTWYKMEERGDGDNRHIVKIKKMPGKTETFSRNEIQRVLSFENVQQSDSGLYECELLYRNSKVHQLARLTVRTGKCMWYSDYYYYYYYIFY